MFLVFSSLKSPKEEQQQIEIKVLKEVYKKQNKIIEDQSKELEYYRNHVKRMQLIVGAKNIDSVFSYKKKIVYKKQLLKCK